LTQINLVGKAIEFAPDAWKQVTDAVLALAGGKDGPAELLSVSETPWKSVTFRGARYVLTFMFNGADAVACGEVLVATLPDHEITLPGRIVACADPIDVRRDMRRPSLRVALELLVIDDA